MKFWLATIVALLLSGLNGFAAEPKGEVPAYYYVAYADAPTVKEKLASGGFEVLATYASAAQSTSIVVTCPGLKKAASKPGRGFAAVMRVLVDDEHKRVAYTNPIYFSKAFLQGDYDYAVAQKAADKLAKALGEGTPSADTLKYDDLAGYHFMLGLPYFEDMDELAEGDNAALLEKLKTFEDGKHVVFTLDLGDGTTLAGYALSDKTASFVKDIGTQNAEVLPYLVLIEDGKAKALAAKYYLAVSYPLLSMGEFMTIASTPGKIRDELEHAFK